MVLDLTDVPLAHVCNNVCCILHEKVVEREMLGVLRVVCSRRICCCTCHL